MRYDADDWNRNSLETLIRDQIPESIHLEYKASAALSKTPESKLSLSKDVSAFANSDGGTIVYGILEAKGGLPVSVDSGSDPAEINKEWLENVINSTIQKRIDGIKIYQVAVREGRFAYIVVIPQSVSAPHMAFDKRFYKRYNFQSVPMEEYEVRDVLNRPRGPDLDVTVMAEGKSSLPWVDHSVRIDLANYNDVMAEYYLITVLFEAGLSVTVKGGEFTVREASDGIRCTSVNSGFNRVPLWKGIIRSFKDDMTVRFPQVAKRYKFSCLMSSPGMADRTREFYLIVGEDGFAKLEKKND